MSDWQPIETAAIAENGNKHRVLVTMHPCCSKNQPPVACAYLGKGRAKARRRWWLFRDQLLHFTPTHWHEIPTRENL